MHGPRAGEERALPAAGRFTVGRGETCDLVLADASVSRLHGAFSVAGGACRVTDEGSRNGVLVNETRVTSGTVLEGDVIRIGTVVLKIVAGPAESAPEPRIIRIPATCDGGYPDPTVAAFLRDHRATSAVRVLTGRQAVWYGCLAAAALVLLNFDWLYFLTLINFICAAFYIVAIFYKLITVAGALVRPGEVTVSSAELAAQGTEGLPVYTVLVPLYREADVAAKIIAALGRLDYPADRLDVKLLLEADDAATLAACRDLPVFCEIIIVPDCRPKTKPRACNHGLAAARGEFLVVYDAEDRPDPDQLKKAVAAFRRHPAVPCFQSKLNYYNPDQNLLTRWFTIEYSAWFDLFLPGLHRQDAPIPLGGTSNHFRTAVLREVGGWDPFNVTEDADLGIRLYRRGHRTLVLDSTTWEEANARLPNWIRQRSRWIKGYLQTHLVHTRHPLATLRELGLFRYISFHLTVGGMAGMLLLNPIYWAAALLYGTLAGMDLAAGAGLWEVIAMPRSDGGSYHAWQMVFTAEGDTRAWSLISVSFFTATVALVVANLVFIAINWLGARRRRLRRMLVPILLAPAYWLLISLAAWKGCVQLLYKPFYWEKTVHGLDQG